MICVWALVGSLLKDAYLVDCENRDFNPETPAVGVKHSSHKTILPTNITEPVLHFYTWPSDWPENCFNCLWELMATHLKMM